MLCSCGPARTAGFWGIGGAFPRRALDDDDIEGARLDIIPLSSWSDVSSPELLFLALDEGVLLASFCRRKLRVSPFLAAPLSVS